MDAKIVAKISGHLAEWETPYVDLEIYGTADGKQIAQALDEFCRRESAIVETLFHQSSRRVRMGQPLEGS